MQVETGKQVLALYRIGPFESKEAAAHAFEILKARSEAWDKEDKED